MTTDQFIRAVAKETGLTVSTVRTTIVGMVPVLQKELAKGETVHLHKKLGKFTIKTIKARKGYNPKTKEPMNIPERSRVFFKVFKELDSAVKGA